jgi:hypothetical protein
MVDNESCVTGCKLIDLSYGGAKLEVPHESCIQSQFTLYVPSKGIDRQVEVVWRAGNRVGVYFVMTTPDCAEAPTSPLMAAPKPMSIDQLRKLALNAVSVEPITPQRTADRWRVAETILLMADVWRRVCAKFKDTVEKLARIIGGDGRIVAANANPRDEAASEGGTPVEVQAARQPKTDLEPVQWPDWPAENQSPQHAAVDPPFSDHADLGEGAHEEWRSHANPVPYGNENFLMAPSGDAPLRLRSRRRRRTNTLLDVTVAAVVMVGVLAVYFVRPGGSALSPADYHADTAAVAKTAQAEANSAPATGPNTSAVAAAQADVEAEAQLSSTPLPNPVNDVGAAAAPAAAPANASPPQQDDGMFMQPKDMRMVPVYGSGTLAEPANMTSDEAQAALVPALTFGQVVAAQTHQTTASAAAAKTSPADANSAPMTGQTTLAVAAGQADADTVAQLTSTPPAKPASDAGAAVAPATGPANLLPPQQDDSPFQQPQRVQPTPLYGGETLAEPASVTPIWVQNARVPDLTFGQFVAAQTLQTTVSATPSSSARDRAAPTNGPGEDVASVEPQKVPARSAAKPAPDNAAAGTTYAAILASPTTESHARGVIAQLQRKYRAALGARRLTYHRSKGAEAIVYEVRAAGLAYNEAQALCAKLSSAGTPCQVESQ